MESLSSIPRGAIRWNVAIQIVTAALLLGAINYFSFQHYARVDLSRSQKFALSDQTKRTLRELDKPVRVTVFFSPSVVSPETQLFRDVQNLLKEFTFSSRHKNSIVVEYVDPTRNLSRARELQGKYQFKANENVLILEYDERVKFVPVAEMADFDLSPMASGDPPRLLAFKGEQALTNAILTLLHPERLTAYFLQGHGEPPVDGDSPVSLFRDYLERQNVAIKPLSLAGADAVPSDCAMLAIIAPKFDLDEQEAKVLRSFWQENGRMFVILDPDVNAPNLRSVVNDAAILPLNNRVLRLVTNPALPGVQGIFRTVVGEFLPKNAITKRLVGLTITLPGATQSLLLDQDLAEQQQVRVWPLIQAAEPYWGESAYITDAKTGVRYDEGVDVGYPVYVAAAAARGAVSDERVEVETAKMVVIGSCEFVFNAAVQPQALDFLSSASNWLLDRQRFTGVIPKTARHFVMHLDEAQQANISFYCLLVIPGAAALLGLIAWWRRRA